MTDSSTQTHPDTKNYENQIGLNYLIRNQFEVKFIRDALNKDSIELNHKNHDGDTALHLAVEGCNKEVVELLVEKGAYVDIDNNCNKTPITIVNEKLILNPNDNTKWDSIKMLLESGAYSGEKGESSSTKPSLKRSGSHLDISAPAPKKPKMYPSSGFKLSLHGIVFQLKLIMLFAFRAIENGLGPFRLASEMDAAEKFDDIVFIMNHRTRFLQAKHKLNCEENKITINSLKSTSNKEDFSLQKYFISFCMIRNNEYFKNSNLDDFVIITNTDFDFIDCGHKRRRNRDELKKWRNFFKVENNLNKDKILHIKGSRAVKYKLNVTTETDELREFMKVSLLNSVLKMNVIKDLKAITDALNAIKIIIFKEIIMKVKQLIEVKNSKDNCSKSYLLSHSTEDFELQGKILDEDLDKIFETLKEIKQKLRQPRQSKEVLDKRIKKYLNTAIEMSNWTIKKLKNSENTWKQYNDIESERSKNFEEDKHKLWKIESGLKEIRKKNRNSNDLEWLREPNEELILRQNLPNAFTNNILKELDSDPVKVKMKLEEKLEETLSEISAIRIFLCNDILEEYDKIFKEFCEKLCFITNYPDECTLEKHINKELSVKFNLIQSNTIEAAFEKEMMKFLKFYCNGMAEFLTSEDIKAYFETLGQQLSAFMVTGLHRLHVNGLRKYDIRFQSNPKELEDFIDQNEQQVFHFQTTTPRLSAIKVLHTIEARNQYKHRDSFIFTDLKTLVTVKISNQILKEPQVIILSAFKMEKSHSLLVIECHDEADGESANRIDVNTLYRQLLEILISNSLKKLILIAKSDTNFGPLEFGDSQVDEIFFRDLEPASQTRVLENKVNFQESDVKLIELIDEASADAIFDQMTLSKFLDEYINLEKKVKIGDKKAFSFIDYVEDFYISRRFIFPNESIRNEDYFYGNDSLEQKVIIVANEAGMGKSTVLTSIANNMKKKQGHLWIIRINLNDYAKSLKRIHFDENGTDEAIEFITKMMRYPRKDPFTRFQQNLFKMGLDHNNKNGVRKPKIVMIFDGFDEVSRNITSTTTLIKALTKSEVAQIWISTRVYKKAHLEEQLKLPAYTLNPLSEPDQIKLASNWWKWILKNKKTLSEKKFMTKNFKEIITYLNEIELPPEDKLGILGKNITEIQNTFTNKKQSKKKELIKAIDGLDFSEYIKKLRDHWASVEDDFHFTKNPLHLSMLTEVIYEKKFEMPQSFGHFYLFNEFIKIKFYIYYKRKGNVRGNESIEDVCNRDSDSLHKIHRAIAVNVIEDALPNELKPFKRKEEEFARVGLLNFYENEDGKELRFIHRSFAEFFYSIYLIENLKVERVLQNAKDIVRKKDDNKLLRQFIKKNTNLTDQLKKEIFS